MQFRAEAGGGAKDGEEGAQEAWSNVHCFS
jgi:hypothetical protein